MCNFISLSQSSYVIILLTRALFVLILSYLVTWLLTLLQLGKAREVFWNSSTAHERKTLLGKTSENVGFFFRTIPRLLLPLLNCFNLLLIYVFNERIWYCITFFRFRRPLQQHHFYKPYKTEGCKCKNRANWFPQSLSF